MSVIQKVCYAEYGLKQMFDKKNLSLRLQNPVRYVSIRYIRVVIYKFDGMLKYGASRSNQKPANEITSLVSRMRDFFHYFLFSHTL